MKILILHHATYDQSGGNVETPEAINLYNSLPMKILILHHKLQSTYHHVTFLLVQTNAHNYKS